MLLVAGLVSAAMAEGPNCEEWNTYIFLILMRLRPPTLLAVSRLVSTLMPGTVRAEPLCIGLADGNESLDVHKALLNAGADPKARDENGITPLHFAGRNENPAVHKVLLNAGADPNARDISGDTPLHYAQSNKNPTVFEVLLGAGADPNARNRLGMTPLHFVVGNENPAVFKVLLDAGADQTPGTGLARLSCTSRRRVMRILPFSRFCLMPVRTPTPGTATVEPAARCGEQ